MKHLIPVLLLFFISCKHELQRIPDDVIHPEKMTHILTDMHMADAVAETKAQTGADERSLTLKYHAQIFKNYSVTHEEFVKSQKFYEDNPVLLNKIYDNVLQELSRRSAAVNKQ